MSRADRLLCCAVTYRNCDILPAKHGKSFVSEKEAVESMMNALWFEAKQSMSETVVAPTDAYLHPVDIDTDEPGIVTSKTKQSEILRRTVPLPRVVYRRRQKGPTDAPPQVRVDPVVSYEDAVEGLAAREAKRIKTDQARARREIKSEERAYERELAKEQKKQQRAQETKEEREERLEEQRAQRAEKKRLKEEKAQQQREEVPAATKKEEPTDRVLLHVQELLEMESDADVAHHAVLPPKKKAKKGNTNFFASPVPFDRHLSALEQSGLHKSLESSVLRAKASSHLQVIHGPPGTGKTKTLASMILNYPSYRILLCAPTNVGAANLYSRVIQYDNTASLLMPASRIPDGTPITSQDPAARIVCSTVSGRAGPLLDNEAFDVVMVDEAGQCMEAWLWCLLRPSVHTLIMVGDTEQLPATVSSDGLRLNFGRSMMERLIENDYPTEKLSVQRRMHPEIVAFPNANFYNGQLTTEYVPCDAPVSPPYLLLRVDGDCEMSGTSYFNREEVSACLTVVKELNEHFERVVVISPYQAQTRELLAAGIKYVHTVDSFQGQEADAVVISVVRNDDIGFWSDHRRLNVALTRAKHCLRIVGSCDRWTGHLQKLADDARARDCVR